MGVSLLLATDSALSFYSFLKAVGPVLLISVGSCIFLGLGLQLWLTQYLRLRNFKNWVALHRESIQKVMILGHAVKSIAAHLAPCPNCQFKDFRFWNFGKGQITYRCTTCHEIIRIRAFSNGKVRLILTALPALLIVLSGLSSFQGYWRGSSLHKLCLPVALYCDRYYNRLTPRGNP